MLCIREVGRSSGTRCLFAVRLKALKPKPNGYPKEINTLGDHLRAKRFDLGVLQEDIALRIGVDETTICNWETNRYEPAISYVPKIIHFLGYCPYRPAISFAQWIKQCRTTWGLSQETLAQAISVDESTIAHWERGEHRPVRRMVEKVTKFFLSVGLSTAAKKG